MKTEDSRIVVKEAWAAFSSQDHDKIAAMFTQDAEWLAPLGKGTALALGCPNHMIGADAIANFIATGMRALFLNVSVDFHGFYAYVNDYCFVFECRDDRIDRVREYMDTLGGHRQLFEDGPPLPLTRSRDASVG